MLADLHNLFVDITSVKKDDKKMVEVKANMDVTVVEGGGTEAIVLNGTIILVSVSDFEEVGFSTSMGGAGGSGALNSVKSPSKAAMAMLISLLEVETATDLKAYSSSGISSKTLSQAALRNDLVKGLIAKMTLSGNLMS
uniref:Uncharacterized protein n=1 Tax=Romanomermis culicivorax TaxID=13658 RepID=A0A915IIM7_ROMCU